MSTSSPRVLGLVFGLSCAAVFGTVLPVAAQSVPSSCTTKPQRTTKYNNGYAAGVQRADNIFNAADVARNPNKLRKKLSKVLDRLHDHVREVLWSDASDGKRCRVQGVADGFIQRLAQLLGQCVLDGGQWAQFVATLYCELSIELDGVGEVATFIRAPTGLCGTWFEQTCDEAYEYIATEAAEPMTPGLQRFLAERGVTLQPYPGCAPYTEAPFDLRFQQSMQADCAY